MLRLITFCSIFLIFGCITVNANSLNQYLKQEEKTVYFVTSHNDNNEWTRRVRAEFSARIKESDFLINVRTIYLDTNSLMSRDARRKVVQSYLDGVNELIDLFVVTDYGATETLLSFTPEERLHIPLVFVSEYDQHKIPDSLGLLTGGYAEIPVEKNFLQARKMLPQAEKVYVWADKTPIGRFYLRKAKEQLSKYEKEIVIEYGIDAMSSEQFLKKAAEVSPNSFVLFCTWQEDDTHHYHNPEYFYTLLTQVTPAPIFPLIDNYVRNGFVGGELISPKMFGQTAARLSLSILEGAKPDDLPVEMIPTNMVYNQKVMKKWDFSPTLIPEKAKTINWEISAHKQYRNQIKLVQIIVTILLLCVGVLLFLYWQRQKRLKALLFRESLLLQIKDKLKFRSEVLSNTISTLREGVVTLDANMQILECNDIFCNLVEIERKNIIGQDIRSVCEFANVKGLKDSLADIFSGKLSTCEISPTFLISRNGLSRYVEGRILSLTRSANEPNGAILMIYDVLTEMRQQKIRSISLEALNAYTWFYDLNNGELVLGDGFSQVGLDPCIITTMQEFAHYVHPLDREKFLTAFENQERANKEEFSVSFRADFAGTGRYEWWESRCVMERSQIGDQEVAYLYGLDVNIDLLKENEQKTELTRQLFSIVGEAAKIGYAKYNLHTGRGFALPQWFKNMDLSPENREDFDFRETFNYVVPDQKYDLLKFYVKAMCRKETAYHGDKKILTPEGNVKWLHGNMLVMENQEGELELIEVTYDITHQKKVEKDLIIAKNKAESANQLKTAFLANMSHEIRTPLNAIVGFCELMMSSECTPEEREAYGKVVMANNELLLKLINDILDLSKIETGQIDFTRSEFDLSELLLNIRLAFKRQMPPGVQFEVENAFDHYWVKMDREKLNQVINNFVNNAIKFTTEGAITLGYVVENEKLEIFVSDTGSGIKEENLPKVFDRFEKLNSLSPGTGLGLSICKAIIEASGGKIGVESVYGEGSVFWITLPLAGVAPKVPAEMV